MTRCVIYLQGATTLLNPSSDQGIIDAAYLDDPEVANAEWGGGFRNDVSAYLDDALVDASIPPGLMALTRAPGVQYYGFTDPSGGKGDAFTLGIAHQERGGRIVLDKLMVTDSPFVPEAVVEKYSETLSAFGLQTVTGDAYGGDWPASTFRKFGVSYVTAAKSKSEIYSEVLPLFTAKRIELLDIQKLDTELRLLERRPRAGGRGDMIDHPRNGRDDCANAALGACWIASTRPIATAQDFPMMPGRHVSNYDPWARGLGDPDSNDYQREVHVRRH